ncbi:MAG: GH39 family glycosyl hydrolase [Nocardioidaceae bacterium]
MTDRTEPARATNSVDTVDARADWENRIYRRLTDTAQADPSSALPAPSPVDAEAGVGHVRLTWEAVDGAAGYLIERAAPGAEPQIVTHGGSDVPAVAGTAFADTGLADGVTYRYRVGAVIGAEHPAWHWSTAVEGRTRTGDPGVVDVHVDATQSTGTLDRVWSMVGSERLTQLRFGDDGHGHDIGVEFAAALAQARDDLGVTHVRAHAVLHDDNALVSRGDDGSLRYDFSVVDALYDQLLQIGFRPIVELSFMPAVLAVDPDQTVFFYRGIISPPKDWGEWREVVAALAAHLVERYGVDEVAAWGFEVWNEPNLEVFWTGTQDDYLRLYAEAARAVKSVDRRLRVGGPSTAASEWVEALAAFAEAEGLPLDFVTTHTYGNVPLDFTPALARRGFAQTPIWWTEWGVGSTHFGPIHDGVAGAPFILSGYAGVQDRMEALAYWVVSDHFEELGRPPRLFHDGFGLLTVGNLRKPRYWAAHLAAHMGDTVLASTVAGDGAGVLVHAWATAHDDGTIDVLVWNGTINAELLNGDARLDRRVVVTLSGLTADAYQVELARVDAQHSNILAAAPDGVDWPDEQQMTELREADALHTETIPDLIPSDGLGRLDFDLPLPGVARIRLRDGHEPSTQHEESAR